MAESTYTKVQRELETAYNQEKDRLDKLHAEVGQLGRFTARGSNVSKVVLVGVVVVGVALFGSLTWIMLTDPTSAEAWPVLIFLVGTLAAWRFLKPR